MAGEASAEVEAAAVNMVEEEEEVMAVIVLEDMEGEDMAEVVMVLAAFVDKLLILRWTNFEYDYIELGSSLNGLRWQTV